MGLYLGEELISGTTAPLEPSRNIGQIIQSTIPLSDAGLHLLNGSLIQGGGIYDDFVQYIASIVETHPSLFVTEESWQSTISSYGACGKFVYNSTENSVRLPKITGFVEGTIDENALGELVQAGLPNITGTLNWGDRRPLNLIESGAFYNNNASVISYYSNDSNATKVGSTGFNASRSSSIYGNSSTVQPQSIKVFYYIVLATTTKTDIEVNVDNFVTDFNALESSKANINLNNLTSEGVTVIDNRITSKISNLSTTNIQKMVGANYSSSTSISSGTTLTKHGYIYWRGSSSGGWIKINGLTLGTSGNYCDQPFANIRVSSGDVITFGNTSTCVLYALKG